MVPRKRISKKSTAPLLLIFFFLTSSALLTTCKPPFQLVEILDGTNAQSLAISPVTAKISIGDTLTFTALGGIAPYFFTVTDGNGSIEEESGLYTAPASAGTDTVQVTDAYGNTAAATIEIVLSGGSSGTLAISPSELTTAVELTVTFSASGGTAPYTFSVSGSGSIVPTTGAYSAPGSAGTDTVIVTDTAGDTASAAVTVLATAGTLTISPNSISVATGGVVPFSGSGGIPPYTFSVQSAGSGSPSINASTGEYTAGGSPGTDTILITDSAATPNTATATVTVNPGAAGDVNYAVNAVNNTGGTTGGGALSGDFSFTNNGANDGINLVTWEVFVSTDAVLSAGDISVDGPTTAPALTAGSTSGVINFSGTWPATDGTYYLIVSLTCADEVDLSDNAGASGAIAVSGSPPPNVDYIVNTVSNGGTPAFEGSPITETFDFENQGTAAGLETVYWTAYISADMSLDSGDPVIDTGTHSALAGGGSALGISIDGTWPAVSASTTYYIFVDVSGGPENNTTNNNLRSGAFTVNPLDIDYTVTAVSNNNTPAIKGSTISETFDLQNAGASAGSETVYWTAYRSTDMTLDGGDSVIDTGTTPGLGAGGTTPGIAVTGSWPDSTGSYYLIVSVSASDENPSKTGNNWTASSAFTINDPSIDYYFFDITASNTPALAGSSISELFEIRNQGADNGSSNVNYTIYISDNASYDVGDDPIKSGFLGGLAAGGTSGAQTIDNANWPSAAGTYYLIGRVWADDESATANNTGVSSAFTITEPDVDYRIESVSQTANPAATGSAINETFTFRNYGADPGGASVYWYAYYSTQPVLDGSTETLFDSGSTTPLGSGATSAGIPITGTWPGTGGNYYIIVKVAASDEGSPFDNSSAGAVFTINAPASIDYLVTSITDNYPTVTTGSVISEKFSVQNIGDTGGSNDINWEAYVSADTVYDGGDTLVNSGTLAALAASASHTNVSISGTWPGSAGTYYLFVLVNAADETETGNNESYSGPFQVNSPPDYHIINPVLPVVQMGGNINEAVSTAGGGAHSFEIENLAAFPGDQTIGWHVYASTDTVFDGGDLNIDSGTLPPIDANGQPGDSAVVNFDGTLPGSYGYYYLLVRINAGDDSNSANNMYISGTVHVWQAAGNNDTDTDDDQYLSDAEDYAIKLNVGDSVQIDGTMDNYDFFDLFTVTTGPSTTSLTMLCTWTTGADDLDLYLYDDSGSVVDSSIDSNDDQEPASPPFTVAVTPDTLYYVSTYAYLASPPAYNPDTSGSTGQPYVLTVTGN